MFDPRFSYDTMADTFDGLDDPHDTRSRLDLGPWARLMLNQAVLARKPRA